VLRHITAGARARAVEALIGCRAPLWFRGRVVPAVRSSIEARPHAA